MANRIARLAEAHTLKLWQIEQLAKNDIEAAYAELTRKISVARIGSFFSAMDAAGREVIGKRGKEAVAEGVRYSESLMGGKVKRPTIADLSSTVDSFLAELGEHTRHVQALIAIRSERMVQKGIGVKTISGVLLEDFKHGGEHTKFLKNSIKRSVGSAVHQLGKEAEFAALRKGDDA